MTVKVALVTGASRGVGKGIALALGEAGVIVYVTGRTTSAENAAVPLAGTIHETAAAITDAGGVGIALACDHRSDEQVAAVFERIKQEQGRLDVLVNNAWAGYEGYSTGKHHPPLHSFWEKPLSYWDDNLDGVRWAYACTWYASPLMVAQHSGLIVNISFGTSEFGNAAYNIAKSATDRLTQEAAYQLREHGVSVVSLYPGLVRTESVMLNAQYFDLSKSESPQFTGQAVLHLTNDLDVMAYTGSVQIVAQLAEHYGFEDRHTS
ncbi:MAG: SDR family NAD(P)-dependent oxidoreductase [Anaerolineae bacterium]